MVEVEIVDYKRTYLPKLSESLAGYAGHGCTIVAARDNTSNADSTFSMITCVQEYENLYYARVEVSKFRETLIRYHANDNEYENTFASFCQ